MKRALPGLLAVLCTSAWASAPIAQYDLKCQVNPNEGVMEVSVDFTPPPQRVSLSKISFGLSEAMKDLKVALLSHEAETPVGLTKGETVNHQISWEASLPEALPLGQTVTLRMTYSSSAKTGFVFNLGPEGCYAGGPNLDWYPQQEDVRCEGDLRFEVPEGFTVKATGKEIGRESQGAFTVWKFHVAEPCLFTFAAAKYYVQHLDGKVPITLYTLKPRQNAKDYAVGCWRILDTLPKVFGKYPYPDFSIIETPSPQSRDSGFSGASFEGFMFADSPSMDAPFNVAYYAHEIGHQWWGNLVQHTGDKGAAMLDEALAQYGSLMAVEKLQGPAMAAKYRSEGYPGYSDRQCTRGALRLMAAGFDKPVSSFPVDYDIAYHEMGDSKGFLVFNTIANFIGRERFHKALQSVTSKYGWSSVTWNEFVDEIKAAAGRNVDSMLHQWFETPGAPVLSASFGGQKITVTQAEPFYDLTLPVRVTLANEKILWRTVKLSAAQTSFEAPDAVKRVEVDPDFTVFHATPELQLDAQAWAGYMNGLMDFLRGNMEKMAVTYRKALASLVKPDKYGVEFELQTALGGYYRRKSEWQQAKEFYMAGLRCAVRDPQSLPWIYLRLAQIAKAQADEPGTAWALTQLQAAEAALVTPSGAVEEAHTLQLFPRG